MNRAPNRQPWRQRSRRPRKSRARRYAEYALTFAILIGMLVVISRFETFQNKQLSGNPQVNDGDSITLAGQRLRLRGIDAPEFNQTCTRNGKSYDCGRESLRSLRELVRSGPLVCDGWERDRFERLLVVCKAGAVDINRRQVELGWAVAYGDYADAEREARQGRKGIWQGEFERPRAYRDRLGDVAEAPHDIYQTLVNWLRQTFGW